MAILDNPPLLWINNAMHPLPLFVTHNMTIRNETRPKYKNNNGDSNFKQDD